MQNMILEYVVERQQKVGVIVGFAVGNQIRIGWSKTNVKKGDTFNRGEGIRIARDRANGLLPPTELPARIRNQMREFQVRCIRYFQQAMIELATPTGMVDNRQQTPPTPPKTPQQKSEKTLISEITELMEQMNKNQTGNVMLAIAGYGDLPNNLVNYAKSHGINLVL